MRLFFIFIYVYICINYIFCLTEGVYFPKKDNVMILTDYTCEEAIKEYPFLLISIYSEICGKCIHKINPLFTSLYKEIENNEPELKDIVGIAKIDGSYNNFFMNKYNIIGYPTILLLNNGIIQAELIYTKKVEDIIIFLRKYILRPIQYINNIKQFNKLTKSSYKDSFITYYGKNAEEINSLKEISNKNTRLTFINIQNKTLMYELNATEGQLSINKFFDEPRIIESCKKGELWKSDTIHQFIKKYNHRLLIEFVTKEGEKLINQRRNILLLINKQELTENQIKRIQYMEKVNIKEVILNDENKENNNNFLEIAKKVRDIIQCTFVIYRKNMINIKDGNDFNRRKNKKRSLLDEDDPFGFEAKRQDIIDRENRQIQFINNKLLLDNETNCEIRLLDFEHEKNPIFYKLKCGKESIEENINFIKKWSTNNLTMNFKSFDLNLSS